MYNSRLIYSKEYSYLDGLQEAAKLEYYLEEPTENSQYGIKLIYRGAETEEDVWEEITPSRQQDLDLLTYLYENGVGIDSWRHVVEDVLHR